MRIIQITEHDKEELSELGTKLVDSAHAFLECLDRTSGGQISQEMADRYGERRGVPGTGRYSRYNRRGGGYNERGDYGERYPMERGYGERYPMERGDYGERENERRGNRFSYPD